MVLGVLTNVSGLGNRGEAQPYVVYVPVLAADSALPIDYEVALAETPTAEPTSEPWPEFSYDSFEFYAAQAGWPDSLMAQLRSVVNCESSYKPYAQNPSGARGLMQLMPVWFRHAGVSYDDGFDPLTNLYVGYLAYLYDLDHGYAPWTQWECKP